MWAAAPHRRDRLYDMCFPSKIYDYLALGLPFVAAWTESLAYYYGADTLVFWAGEGDGREQLRRFAEEVVPATRERLV